VLSLPRSARFRRLLAVHRGTVRQCRRVSRLLWGFDLTGRKFVVLHSNRCGHLLIDVDRGILPVEVHRISLLQRGEMEPCGFHLLYELSRRPVLLVRGVFVFIMCRRKLCRQRRGLHLPELFGWDVLISRSVHLHGLRCRKVQWQWCDNVHRMQDRVLFWNLRGYLLDLHGRYLCRQHRNGRLRVVPSRKVHRNFCYSHLRDLLCRKVCCRQCHRVQLMRRRQDVCHSCLFLLRLFIGNLFKQWRCDLLDLPGGKVLSLFGLSDMLSVHRWVLL
jgi:hypothetical protein